jgi:catechol 2,3-dioxygenase-like lactoylglutathione lyase family enzyme
MLTLKGIDHVGLKVSDLDAALRFYQALGLTVLRTSGPSADGTRSAVIRVGSQELNVFAHPGFAPASRENRVGMDHLCFEVDAASIEDVMADLRQAGIAVVKGPDPRRDGTALFLHDPDGTRVELQLKSRAPCC